MDDRADPPRGGHLRALRDLVIAAELAGWDGDAATRQILQDAREAYAALEREQDTIDRYIRRTLEIAHAP